MNILKDKMERHSQERKWHEQRVEIARFFFRKVCIVYMDMRGQMTRKVES